MNTQLAHVHEPRLVSSALPHTGGLPLLGILPRLIRGQFTCLLELQHEHGDMFWLDLAGQSILMVCHPAIIEDVALRKAQCFPRGGPLYEPIRPLAGDGLLTVDGEVWRRQRRLMQPLFHHRAVADMTRAVCRRVGHELDAWGRSEERPEACDLTPLMTHISMQVALDVIFGASLDEEHSARLCTNLGTILDGIIVRWITAGMPRWLRLPRQRRYDRALREVDQEFYRLIEERRRRDDYGPDILGSLMRTRDTDGSAMSDEQLRDELASLIVAAYEATGHTLNWAAWLLAAHPEALARVRAEALEHLPAGRAAEPAAIEQMRFTRWAWEETLRLYPSGLFLPRVARQDETLAGHPVPAGTTVICSIYNVHHHRDLWDEPERFDPERFDPDKIQGRHRLAFMPFGVGRHLCLGKPLAMLEGVLVLGLMARDFELATIPERRPEPRISTTMRSKNGVWLRVRRRS